MPKEMQVRPEAPAPQPAPSAQQEVNHLLALPTAPEQWLPEFAQGERQTIGRELKLFPRELTAFGRVCKSSNLRAFLKTVNVGAKQVRES